MCSGGIMEKNMEIIRKIAEFIRIKHNPVDIFLFGSYAKGSADDSSDVDILIVMHEAVNNRETAYEIRKEVDEKFGVNFPMDILVRSKNDIEEGCRIKDSFIVGITRDGVRI
jgi:uncharacterized protein